MGIAVLGACAVWTLISATARTGRPEGVLLAVLAVAAGYACGRIGGALVPVGASCLVGCGGLGIALLAPGSVPAPDTLAPLGRSGATAALLALSAGALCCAAWSARRGELRVGLHLAGAGVVVVAAVTGSGAGVAACTAVVLCSLAAARMRRRALGLAGLGLGTALVVAVSLALAQGVLPSGLADTLEGRITRHRLQLWHEALRLAKSDPVLGVGPGRFGELDTSLVATAPPDGKPHSAVLQVAAEQGAIGLFLLAAAYCWVLYVLWRSARSTPVVLSAGAALTAVAVLATVGNALSFTSVTAGVGLLAGMATAEPLAEEPPHDEAAAPERVRDGR
ncbi:O-antigen ligase family protein [Streptomyces xanthii]|uniref:O-antigen ligase family protein n=1 Tax=Streptomyces xanthii TaxID=2768069 RepID=UPI002948BDD8|nr:O-antigen ligase family protein [Streptomyces xanthii]